MNTTILEVAESSLSPKARAIAEELITSRAKRLLVTFNKKNGSERKMTIVPRNSWNELQGLETTEAGRRMTAAKVAKGIINVVELLPEGRMQPRSITLDRVTRVERISA